MTGPFYLARMFHLLRNTIFGLAFVIAATGCMLNTDRAVSPSPGEIWAPPADAIQTPISSPSPSPSVSAEEAPVFPSAPTGEPSDLASLIDESLTHNPETQRAWFDAKAAAARELEGWSTYYPSLSVAENLQRQRIETIGGSFGISVPENTKLVQNRTTYGPMLDVSYTLFTFGAQTALAQATTEALYAANFQFNRGLQNLVLATQESYYQLHAAESAIVAEEASLKDAQAALDAAQTKNEVGLSPIQDVLKAKSNLLEEQYRLEATRALVESSRARLAQVIGRPDVNSVRIKAPEIQPAPPQVDEDIRNLIDHAMAGRPDLQSAYAAVRSTENEKVAATRSLLPKIVGGISSDFTQVYGFDGTEQNYLAYVQAQWDIFDGFMKEGRVLEARSRLEAAKRDAKAAELAAVSDVWTQYYGFKSAREKLVSAQGLVSASEAAFAAIDTGYKTGLNSILDLLSAQRDLASARLTLIKSQSDYTTSIARLANAVGEIPSLPAPAIGAGDAQAKAP